MYVCMYVCMSFIKHFFLPFFIFIFIYYFIFLLPRLPELEVGGPVRRRKELHLAILKKVPRDKIVVECMYVWGNESLKSAFG